VADVMPSSEEYREYARECMDWARTARSERERAIFVEMAQTWLAAAARRLGSGCAESIEKNVGNGGAPINEPGGQPMAKLESQPNDNNPNR
jgi:hypothetical protein